MKHFFTKKPKLFDDKKSVIHFLLGLITPPLFPYSLIIPAAFTIYQLREKESIESKIGDFIEYMLGLVPGLPLVVLRSCLLNSVP